jgi:hypothetical protein
MISWQDLEIRALTLSTEGFKSLTFSTRSRTKGSSELDDSIIFKFSAVPSSCTTENSIISAKTVGCF